jgi:DNA-directed RNA polymerase specialized sigma24 family protein
MLEASYRVVRDWDDAEDATSEATETALTKRPQLDEDDWAPWLCRVAQNKAKDILRRKKREQRLRAAIPSVTGVLADKSSDVEIGAGTLRLLNRIRPFVPQKQQQNFALYCRVELGHVTVGDLARELGVPAETLRSRLRRVGKVAHDAAVAVCLVDDPNRCLLLFSLVKGGADSPTLLSKITRHINGCETCRENRDKSGGLRRNILLVPGVGLIAGLLAQAMARKKSAAMVVTSVVAIATVAVVLVELPEAAPRTLYPMLSSPTFAAPSAGMPEPPPDEEPPQQPPQPGPAEEEEPAPDPGSPVAVPSLPPSSLPPRTVPVLAPEGEARNDTRPIISGGSIEHRRITTAEQGRCGDEPTMSRVSATITAPSGVRNVVVYLWRDDEDLQFPMTNAAGTSTWHGEIASEDTGGRFAVAIAAVDVNGAWTAEKIGEICIATCS